MTDASVRVGAARPWHENHDESGGTDGVTAVRDVVSMLELSPASSDERARARSKWFHLPETMSPSALILARSFVLQLFLLNAARVFEAVWIPARVYSGRVQESSPLVVAVRHTAANGTKQKIGTIGEVTRLF